MLIRKVIRDMLGNKKSYLSCISLIMIGILIYNALGITSLSMQNAKIKYYKKYNLADVFSEVKSIPSSEISSLNKIQGINSVLGRNTLQGRVVGLNDEKIITLKLIGVKNNKEADINGYLYKGKDFYNNNNNDIMLGKDFMESNNLKTGDTITVIISNKQVKFNICAIAESPEFVYAIKNAKEVLPDTSTYGYGFTEEGFLQNISGTNGTYNDISFKLDKGYTYDDVKLQVEDYLNKYGILYLIPQKDQLSYAMLEQELMSIGSMTVPISIIFVGMAMIVLYLMMRRLIEKDRTQVGTLKAFGYSNRKILFTYMSYGIITGIIGGIIGTIFGYFSADSMINMYLDYFSLPDVTKNGAAFYVITGVLIATIGGGYGAYSGAKNIIKLTPAESMKSSSPPLYKGDIIGKITLLKIVLNSTGIMALRGIFRNKFRSFFVVISIVFSFGIMALMGSYNIMIDSMMLDQFTKIQKYDAKIIFNKNVDLEQGKNDVLNIKAVSLAEGILELPVTFYNENRKESANLTGVEENSMLYKIYDGKTQTNKNIEKGVILSSILAKKLEVKIGDKIYIETSISKEKIPVLVDEIVEQNVGLSAYVSINELSKMLNTKKAISGVIFNTSDINIAKKYAINGTNVALIENKSETLDKYNEMLEPYGSIMYIALIGSILVGFAIIYNTAVISLSEREREYATLRVLGMHITEVSSIMNFEYWFLCIFGILLGFPFTQLLKQGMSSMLDVSLFTFPMYTPPSAYVLAIIGCAVSVWFGNISSKKHIGKFDMVEVLKERE